MRSIGRDAGTIEASYSAEVAGGLLQALVNTRGRLGVLAGCKRNTERPGVREAGHATKAIALTAVRSACLLLCHLVPFVGQGGPSRLLQSNSPRMVHIYLYCWR